MADKNYRLVWELGSDVDEYFYGFINQNLLGHVGLIITVVGSMTSEIK